MIWETGIAGLGIRYFAADNDDSVKGYSAAMLQGPIPWESLSNYFGRYFPYDDFDPQTTCSSSGHVHMAQAGGWTETREQILHLHLNICQGSHLPPYGTMNTTFGMMDCWDSIAESNIGPAGCNCTNNEVDVIYNDHSFGK